MYKAGGGSGSPRLTARDLDEGIARYFDFCDTSEPPRFPTEPGLVLFLGLSERAWREMLAAKDGYKSHAPYARRALLEIRDRLEQRRDSTAIFLLKQRRYGGYTDKPEADGAGGMQIHVTFGKPGSRKTDGPAQAK